MIFKRTIKLPPLFLLLFLFILSNHTFAIVTCSDPVEECIEGKDEVRYIDNVPVSPGCWKYRVTYECRETSDNNCQLLREAGCSQLSASCKTMLNGSCVVQDEVYNCPVKKCEQVNNIQCAKSDKKGIFCKDGACAETDDKKNNNFEQSAASLAALAAAAKDVKAQNVENPIIFAGRALECSKNMLGAKNCCNLRGTGWAEGIFLKCDCEERELGMAKASGRAIYVGEYCYNSIGPFCSSYHEVYCVFDSKIAKIVQQEGRGKQLGIGFGYVGGDDSYPDCRGVTKEELAKMKFDQMDFSEFASDLTKRIQGQLSKGQLLEQKVKNYDKNSDKKYNYEDLKDKTLNIQNKSKIEQETDVGLKAAERVKDFYGNSIKNIKNSNK